MADGYAMASGRLGVACVHISGGLGNAMGMIFNVYREGTPLLIMAGQQDRRLRFQEPAMESDMVAVARPWTKWAAEVSRGPKMCRPRAAAWLRWRSPRPPAPSSWRYWWTCNSNRLMAWTSAPRASPTAVC